METVKLLLVFTLVFFSKILVAQHLKKDGTPDMRYKENRTSYSTPSTHYSNSTTHLKKDGTPDKRFKENRIYSSIPSTSTSPSYKYYTSTGEIRPYIITV